MTEQTTRRWTDSTKVIYALFAIIGFLLATGYAHIRATASDNTAKIEKLREVMNAQVTEINRTFNSHLGDPKLHRAATNRIYDRLGVLVDGMTTLQTQQSSLMSEQRTMRTEIEVIRSKIGE